MVILLVAWTAVSARFQPIGSVSSNYFRKGTKRNECEDEPHRASLEGQQKTATAPTASKPPGDPNARLRFECPALWECPLMGNHGLIWLALILTAASAPAAEPGRTGRVEAGVTTSPSNLPFVFLQTTQRIVSSVKVPCSARLVLPGTADAGNTAALPARIEFHGATSLRYPKKSFDLSLNVPVQWLGLPERRRWVLNAAAVDHSLMRHKLSYDLFRSLSATGAPRFAAASRFVEVNLNGRYQGVYLLMERVDRRLLGLRAFDSNAMSQACLYKAVDHGADFGQTGHWSYEQHEPSPLVRPYWGPLEELNHFVSAAPDAEFFDRVKGIASRVDLACVIDFHLLVLLTSNMDGYDKNFVLARDAATAAAPRPRFFFVPWDYDATFGRNWEGSRVSPTEWQSNSLFDRLLSNGAYRRRFAARWKQLRTREFSVATIERLIDENARTLGDAVERNASRWETLERSSGSRLSFEEDLGQMKNWVAARTRWLDAEIAERTASSATDR